MLRRAGGSFFVKLFNRGRKEGIEDGKTPVSCVVDAL